MGLIGNIFRGGIGAAGEAVVDVAEVFRPNATRQIELEHDAFVAALEQQGKEFVHVKPGLFDAVMNGLNRLPRPMLAFGTFGLFVFAMLDPVEFSARMAGLAFVPEPLWWLLGAIVSFYFGARELHYRRGGMAVVKSALPRRAQNSVKRDRGDNPALEDWRQSTRDARKR